MLGLNHRLLGLVSIEFSAHTMHRCIESGHAWHQLALLDNMVAVESTISEINVRTMANFDRSIVGQLAVCFVTSSYCNLLFFHEEICLDVYR